MPTPADSNTNIDEADLDEGTADPSVLRGRINVRSTGLPPWTADNFDLSVEYYTDQGGLFSFGAFQKDIEDFFGESVRLATVADLLLRQAPSRDEAWRADHGGVKGTF